MKKYLIKLKFTKHNGEQVFGTKLVDQSDKEVIDEFSDGHVTFAVCEDCGGVEIFEKIKDVFTITEISDKEAKTIQKFGLDGYGALEGWTVDDILYTNDDEVEVDELQFLGPIDDEDYDDFDDDDDGDDDDEDYHD
jgi:hypothetical protein